MDLDLALGHLLERGGSDLLLSCGSRPRIRKDGKLEPFEIDAPTLAPADTKKMVSEILDAKQLKVLDKRRHVDFAFTWHETSRIRGNVYYQRNSLAIAFRLLPLEIPNFDMLGLPEAVHRLLERRQGLILVTGPTGSGKSTTQAAMIDLLNTTRPYHIITIEDPIEYVHKHKLSIVDQRQVGDDTPSFAEGLRGAFREERLRRRLPSPRPDIWCWRRCTPMTPARRSTASSTATRVPSNSKFVSRPPRVSRG
jgi:twitching motility protein PilT